jgi:putative ABC transport system permease protein
MRWLFKFPLRLRSLFRKKHVEQELSDELRFHIEKLIDDKVAQGMPPDEARYAALREIGGVEQIKEECRDMRRVNYVENFLQDVRYGLRQLRRNPGFTAVAALTLALGVGANTAVFSIIHTALLKPLPFQDPGRLVLARATFSGTLNPFVSAPDYYDYREQNDCFDGFSAVLPFEQKTTVTGGTEPQRVSFTYVAHDLFRTLGVAPAAGRWFTSEEGQAGKPPVVMVSAHFAQRRFGAPQSAVGASLAMEGKPYTVVGVMPATFRFLYDADVWAPMRRGEAVAGAPRHFHNWLIVGRLKPGVSIESAQRQVDVISKRLEQEYPASNTNKALRLDPLQAALAGEQTPQLLVLMAAVGLVLLIACANVAGLLLARGVVRRSELAVRAALGASRTRIAGQLLVESMTLALLSGVLGVALAFWLNRLLPLVTGLGDPGSTPKGLDWPVMLFALALSILTGILFGVAPALRASSLLQGQDLLSGTRTTGSKLGTSLRGALVVGQVAISLVLLVGAGLLTRSFVNLARTNLGFNVQHLLTGEIQLLEAQYPDRNQRVQFFEGLREDFAAAPGVRAVGFISQLPIRNPGNNIPAWDADQPPRSPADVGTAHKRVVLPGYFDAVRIPLLSGRDFGTGDREHAPLTMIINEEMARTLFGERSPLGRRVSVDMGGAQPTTFEVVGVVGNARLNYVGDDTPMAMYLSYYQFPQLTLRFAIRTDQEAQSITGTVRRLVMARNHDIPVENLISMEQLIGDSLAPQQVSAIMVALFAGVALLLASIGLYGVLAYSVSQRTHEIGLRVALGAERRDVLKLIVGQGFILTLLGVGIGIVGAVAVTRLLADMLYGVKPIDLSTFAAVSVLLTAVSLLASYIPARRAAKVDPMVALRYE